MHVLNTIYMYIIYNVISYVYISETIKTGGKEILEQHHPQHKYRVNVHSIFWMVAAMCVFYYTDYYIALRIDPRIHR